MRYYADENEYEFRVKVVNRKSIVNPEYSYRTNSTVPYMLYPEDAELVINYYGPYLTDVSARIAAVQGRANTGPGFVSMDIQKIKRIEWEDYIAPCRTCGHTDIPVVEKVVEPPKSADYDERDERIDYNPNPARWSTPPRMW